jgi:hypothetical protein
MSITLAGYNFEGPYHSTSAIEDRAGVYAVLSRTENNRYNVLDAGESAQVRSRLENHDRRPCWERHKANGIQYAVCYTPGVSQDGRREIEKSIRDRCDPPCGKV